MLRAFKFTYDGSQKAETFRFYNRYIRGFLRWHRGNAVWIKGNIAKREAYLIIVHTLSRNVKRMFSRSLEYGGRFKITEVNPHLVIDETLKLNRHVEGLLRHGGIELGDPYEIFCPKERYRKVDVQQYCWGKKFDAKCDAWNGKQCVYPRRVTEKKEKKIECPYTRRTVSKTECDKCKVNNPIKWEVCQDARQKNN